MDPKDFLPLSTPMYAVLITLGDDALHGYGVIQRFEQSTGQDGTLLPGSVYNTISRLTQLGLLEEVPPPSAEADVRKRYYAATELGKAVARAESERLQGMLRLAAKGGLAGA